MKRFISLRTIILAVQLALVLASGWLGYQLFAALRHDATEASKDGRVVTVDTASGAVNGSQALPQYAGQAASASPPPAAAPANNPETPPAAPVQSAQELAAPVPAASGPPVPDRPPEGVALPPAPEKGLVEDTQLGPLPKIDGDKTPAKHYARSFTPPSPPQPMIAVLVTGLGMSRQTTEPALHLPAPMALTLSPYAQYAKTWAEAARAWGHEIYLELPAEPMYFPSSDPGPQGLLTINPPAENNQRLRWVLSRFTGYAGVFLPADERLSAVKEASQPIFKFIDERGLYVVAGNSQLRASAEQQLSALSMPLIKPDVVVKEAADADTLARQLLETEERARKKNKAFLVVSASPASVAALAEWSKNLENKGYVLAPVSALARK